MYSYTTGVYLLFSPVPCYFFFACMRTAPTRYCMTLLFPLLFIYFGSLVVTGGCTTWHNSKSCDYKRRNCAC